MKGESLDERRKRTNGELHRECNNHYRKRQSRILIVQAAIEEIKDDL